MISDTTWQQLHSWFYNKTGGKARKASKSGAAVVATLLSRVKPRRSYQEVELYSKKYYAEKVQPLVRQELDSRNVCDMGTRLKIVRECTFEAYKSESPRIREEIANELEEMKNKAKEAKPDNRTPEMMQR